MGINKIIQVAVVMAFVTAGTGQLPKIVRKIQIAQLELLKEAQASKWGTPWSPSSDR